MNVETKQRKPSIYARNVWLLANAINCNLYNNYYCIVKLMSPESTFSSQKSKKIDEGKLNDFMGKVVNDLGATWSSVLVIIGDKLGLYKAMADSKPIGSEVLRFLFLLCHIVIS